MVLLIITQKFDERDQNLGAFYDWFTMFGKKLEKVIIIAGSVSARAHPVNIEVYSYGKDLRYSRLRRAFTFYKLLLTNYFRTDAVFFHMVPEYVIAASPLLLFSSWPSALWYGHKNVNWKLKLAERLVTFIFSTNPASFRLPSSKVTFFGHAIDSNLFSPAPLEKRLITSPSLRLLTVGRISPSKNYETLIEACLLLRKSLGRDFSLSIVGGPLTPHDEKYLKTLKESVTEKGLEKFIKFWGPRTYRDIAHVYTQHDMFISTSTTGSLDKVNLEAMSCGLTVLTTNEAFKDILPSKYFIDQADRDALAKRITALADEKRPNVALRDIVLRNYSDVGTIVDRMINIYSTSL